jgi:hypothetical protein
MDQKPNDRQDALLVILDTFRTDHMRPDQTPRIWAHAQEAWWPSSAWTPSSWTVPSVSALFTGRPPWAIAHSGDHRLPQEQTSLPELLPEHESWMISVNAFVTASNGFAQGFDRFARVQTDAEALRLAQDWWSENQNRGRFLVVQLMGSHLPYEPAQPPEGASPRVGDQFWDLDNWASYTDPLDQARIRALYAASVQDVDQSVGALLDLIGPQAITALISDHGEELFEQGGFEHGHAFWEEITRIHAAIRIPGEAPSRPEGYWSIQAIGQALAKTLQVEEQPTWFPTSRAHMVHGYPLAKRDKVLHQWGARRGEAELFLGTKAHRSTDSESLLPLIEAAKASARISQAKGVRWCKIDMVAGEPLLLPLNARWPTDSPPAAWGSMTVGVVQSQLTPTRSGTWRLSGVEGRDCEMLTEAHPWKVTDLEQEALEALGYIEPDFSAPELLSRPHSVD